MARIGTAPSLALAALAVACSQQTPGAVPGVEQTQEQQMTQNASDTDQPIRQLPFAHGRSFATLDEYLAHLRNYAGPVGQPWYRKAGPDTYELVTTRVPPGDPQIFTREELMRRFGFTR